MPPSPAPPPLRMLCAGASAILPRSESINSALSNRRLPRAGGTACVACAASWNSRELHIASPCLVSYHPPAPRALRSLGLRILRAQSAPSKAARQLTVRQLAELQSQPGTSSWEHQQAAQPAQRRGAWRPGFVYDPAYEEAWQSIGGSALQAWYKRRHTPYDRRPGRGGRPASHDALEDGRTSLVQCQRAGCSALVQLAKATQQAALEGRETYAAGDGCGSRLCCSGIYHKGRWEARQRELRAGIQAGEHSVRAWPATVPWSAGRGIRKTRHCTYYSAVRPLPPHHLVNFCEFTPNPPMGA